MNSTFIGNAPVVDVLRRAVERGRLPHAMIFAGPAGTGKQKLARLLAQYLNCQGPDSSRPCGACASCKKIESTNHPDVREIAPDGAYIKIDQIRNLIKEVGFQPFEGKFRVLILDGAEQMRQEAANSLLKTLEEPASRTILILITTSPHSLLATIRSRCRLLTFGGIPSAEIERYLQNQGRSPEEARLAALFSNGSLTTALNFAARDFLQIRDYALKYVRIVLGGGGFTEVSQLSALIVKEKDSFRPWCEVVLAILQDAYLSQFAPDQIRQADLGAELQDLASRADANQIAAAIQAFRRLLESLTFNVNRQVALEALYLSLRPGSGVRPAPVRMR